MHIGTVAVYKSLHTHTHGHRTNRKYTASQPRQCIQTQPHVYRLPRLQGMWCSRRTVPPGVVQCSAMQCLAIHIHVFFTHLQSLAHSYSVPVLYTRVCHSIHLLMLALMPVPGYTLTWVLGRTDTDVPLIHLTHPGSVPVSAGKAVLHNTQPPNLRGVAQPNEQLLMLYAGWQGFLLHVAKCWRLLIHMHFPSY